MAPLATPMLPTSYVSTSIGRLKLFCNAAVAYLHDKCNVICIDDTDTN